MKKTMTLLLLLCAVSLRVPAQTASVPAPDRTDGTVFRDGSYLRQLQERDSVLIGDQLAYGFRLEGLKDGTPVALPDFSRGFRDSVVVVRGWQMDTVRGKDGTLTLDASIVITSFDEGLYDLPPLAVLTADPLTMQADTLVFRPKVLDVRTLPVDVETYEPHDIRPQIRYPLTWKEVLPWVLGILLAAALVFLAVRLWKRLQGRSGDVGRPDDPAHIVALRKLDRYRGSRFWAPDRQKAFYSGVTDALREYIAARYDVPAMEQTTAEMFDALRGADIPEDLRSDMRRLFEVSDFVKFAKMTVSDEDNAKVIPSAVNFVTGTYRTETEKEADHVL